MRSRSLRITAGLAAVLLATLGGVGCRSSSQASDQPLARDTSGPLGAVSWAAPFATAAIATKSGPEFMIAVDGAIWVSAHRGGALQRIDPVTNTVTDTVSIDGELEQPVFMFGSIWVISTSGHDLFRVDPNTRQVTGTVPCSCHGGALAKYGNLVATSIESSVIFYDPVTMKQVRGGDSFHGDDDETIYGFAFVGDDTWAIGDKGTKIYRVSLTTLKVTLVVPMSVLTIAYVGGRLLALDNVGRLQQIDPTNGNVTATWQLAKPDKYDFTSGVDVFDDGTGNGVWVNPVSTALTHVDLTTGQTRQITGLQFQPEVNQNVLVADGTMWVSDWRNDVVLRMKS
jgi:streptogramin lyase